MAANPVFKKILVKDVELQYPRLDATYRFNSQEQRSEPCSPSAQGASWSVSWTLSHEDAKALHADLSAHYNECKARDTTLPAFSKVFGMKKLDNGLVSFRAKKNGTNRAGDQNTGPMVIGADKQPLADKAIWSGSKGTMRIIAFPSKSPQGEGGVSLLLDAVQVLEPIYGDAGGMDDFEIVRPPLSTKYDDPFDLPTIAPDPKPSAAPAPAAAFDMDDEIPF